MQLLVGFHTFGRSPRSLTERKNIAHVWSIFFVLQLFPKSNVCKVLAFTITLHWYSSQCGQLWWTWPQELVSEFCQDLSEETPFLVTSTLISDDNLTTNECLHRRPQKGINAPHNSTVAQNRNHNRQSLWQSSQEPSSSSGVLTDCTLGIIYTQADHLSAESNIDFWGPVSWKVHWLNPPPSNGLVRNHHELT